MNTKILAEVFSETDLTYIQQLDERQHRLYCATRAISIGKHGVAGTLDESYVSERQKRIIFDEQLPKWNYVVRCKSA